MTRPASLAALATLAALMAIAGALMPADAAAQAARSGFSGDQPVLMTADEMDYDENNGIVTARGNVEAVQGERILLADQVSYNRRTEVVTASGNVSMVEPSGEVVFADFAELTDDMKDGFVSQIRLLMVDNSRLAAAEGRRIAGTRKELRRGVFSPCELCKEDPSRAPLWQVRASRVTHDEVAKDIIYRDAVMEFYGIPVFYTPYLSHADPTVDRRSGILTPRLGQSSSLGTIIGVPYFAVLGQSTDLTVEPLYFSNDGEALALEYRRRFSNGETSLRGSFGYLDERNGDKETGSQVLRGHIDSTARFHVSDTWRAGADVQRASGRTYMRRYQFGAQETLTSRLYAERFDRRSYTLVSAYDFQGLRSSDRPENAPRLLPLIEDHYVSPPGDWGGRFDVTSSFTGLSRDQGQEYQRLSLNTGWTLPYIAPAGDVYSFRLSVRGDGYASSDVPQDDGSVYDGNAGRVLPMASLDWRYPLVRDDGPVRTLVEPRVAVHASPRGSNPGKIANEDSQYFDLDDANLFRPQRFAGLDRVSSGSRVDYGVKTGLYGAGGGATTLFVGQSFRVEDDGTYPIGSGHENQLSDLVGRLTVSPSAAVDLYYRFRYDAEDAQARFNEVGLNVGPSWLRLGLDYTQMDRPTGALGPDVQQVAAAFSWQALANWNLNGRIIHALDEDEGTRLAALGLTYGDECLIAGITYERRFTRDQDIEPGTTVFFRIIFKHLGGIEN